MKETLLNVSSLTQQWPTCKLELLNLSNLTQQWPTYKLEQALVQSLASTVI